MRKLLFVFTLLSVNIFLKAQTKIGFHIGGVNNNVSLQNMTDQVNENVAGFTGYSSGIDVIIRMDEKFSFKTGVNYKQKGFDTDLSTSFNIGSINVPVGASAEIRANYIDIPIAIQYDILSNEKVNVYGFAGAYAAYNTKAFMDTKANLLFDINVKRFDIDRNANGYNKMDLGAQIGGGAEIKIGSGALFGEVGYEHGFNKQIQNPYVDLGIKNRSVNFGIGYKFSL
jgi:hypothetical protein